MWSVAAWPILSPLLRFRRVSLTFTRGRSGVFTVLAIETLLTASLIPLTFLLLERLSRITVLSARTPIAATRLARHLKRALSFFWRRPELASLEPFHLRVGMTLLQPTKRWQQVVAFSGAKRRWESSCEDRPVRKTWRHELLKSESFEFLDECCPFDAQKFGGAISVSGSPIE
jgi:hypothetical protein